MTTTLTLNNAGQIDLPEPVRRVFQVKPGARLRAEVTAGRLEIVQEAPLVTETARSSSERLVLAPTGLAVASGRAVREEREALVSRAAR